MMTMTTTAVRAMSSLNVPSTQNTAPILDFRCLYSYDLRRKAKRWQDGVLRFHTFNKRVMVYDVPRNFIGDTHWREDEPVQDGDEFQLEKGVLVQVGEETGKVDQDLTGVIHKKGKAHAESSAKAGLRRADPATTSTVRPTSSATVDLSQLRPKTLNSLLGTPKGPLGRAALPTKSPCEQRKEDENRNIEDRPAKRRRLDVPSQQKQIGSIRTPVEEITSPSSVRPASDAKQYIRQEVVKAQVTTASRETVVKQATKLRSMVTISVDSEDEQRDIITPGTVGTRASARKQQKMAPAEERKNQKEKPLGKSTLDAVSGVDESRVQPTIPEHISTSETRPPASIEPRTEQVAIPHASMNSVEDEPERSAPMRLRIVSTKPRKKLMYRDLLPQEPNTKAQIGAATGRLRKTEPENPLSGFHQEQQDRLRDRLRRQKEAEASKLRHSLEDNDTIVAQSPSLFVTQEYDPEIPPTNPDAFGETLQNFSKLPSDNSTNHTTSKQSSFLNRKKPPDHHPTEYRLTSTDAGLTLSEMDQLLLCRPKPNSSSKGSSPSHTFSSKPLTPPTERDPSMLPENLTTTSLTTPKPQPPPLNRSLSTSTSPPRKRSPLRKTTSDITSLRPANPPLILKKTISNPSHVGNPPGNPHDVKEAEPDPWSREAWDLFGCGRPGDGYGDGEGKA